MPPSSAHVARRPLVVATGNPGKLREFRALLADMPFDLRSLGEMGIAAPEETGASFLENALLKARHAAAAAALHGAPAGCAAIADDSGLEVDALGGRPGDFFGALRRSRAPTMPPTMPNCWALWRGFPPEQRRARYRCALVFVAGAEDAAPVIAEGAWEGCILEAPRGSGGFGYDPYFWLPDLGLTAAQLDPEEKNRLSHRGMAMRALRRQLRDQLAACERESASRQWTRS